MTAKKNAKRKAIPAILLAYSDSDFTNPHEAMLTVEPKDCRGDFTHMGAKYWGYETRRHKATKVDARGEALVYDHDAHNWMLIGLNQRAKVDTVTISTKWYTGNQVRAASVFLSDELSGKAKKVLDRVTLKPDSDHTFKIAPTFATECYVECYYEGGISRVNLFGEIAKEQLPQRPNLLKTAKITHVSNEHYGKPDRAVVGERQQMHMFGWESARTGFGERALFHLERPAIIDEVVVDTYLHRLNAPLTSHVYAVNAKGKNIESLMKSAPRWGLVFDGKKEVIPQDFQAYMLGQKYLKEKGVKDNLNFQIRLHLPKGSPWYPVVPFAPLRPDTYHRFGGLDSGGAVTHVLYMHYPHGGIHGLKVFGTEVK
jgi:allantoicase